MTPPVAVFFFSLTPALSKRRGGQLPHIRNAALQKHYIRYAGFQKHKKTKTDIRKPLGFYL